MKKVLVILFYWPPGGGMAVQRWLKFSKYLPEHGWEPVIYAPENAEYPEIDPSLENEIHPGIKVIKQPIFEPFRFYKRFMGIKKKDGMGVSMALKDKPSGVSRIKNKLSVWIRGNFFIPDARVLWVRPSVRFLRKYLKSNPVDVIITTGTPHSLHLIGRKLKPYLQVPWIADFRDLWTKIDFYADLKLTPLADHIHHRLEREVVQGADHIITVGEIWKEEFLRLGAKEVTVITNGYDPDDIPAAQPEPDRKFTLVHVGSVGKNRNATALWKVLGEKVKNDDQFGSDLEIKLAGSLDYSVLESIAASGLQAKLTLVDYLTHPEAMRWQQNAQVLLLLINNSADARGRLTGKIFEYIAAGRPVLAIGPEDGEAARLLEELQCGWTAGFENAERLAELIDMLYDKYQNSSLHVEPVNPERFSRKNLAGKVAGLLDRLTMDPARPSEKN